MTDERVPSEVVNRLRQPATRGEVTFWALIVLANVMAEDAFVAVLCLVFAVIVMFVDKE